MTRDGQATAHQRLTRSPHPAVAGIGRQLSAGLVLLLLPLLAMPVMAEQPANQTMGDVRTKSDEELTALTAQWGQLSAAERRVLLAEVRGRMQQKRRAAQVTPRVKVTRRYGRIIRKPDGSVVVQTHVIGPAADASQEAQSQTHLRASEQMPPNTEGQRPQQGVRITFGFGFERRGRASAAEIPAAQQSPTDQVATGRVVEGPAETSPNAP